ncbi:hypothetical protein L6R52_39140, partial [Myxococcota bacterium]|nr:hypothetical protein [Myxococcota bacterium]
MTVQPNAEHTARAPSRERALERILRTISSANRRIAREPELDDKLRVICDIAVDHGFALAWVGMRDAASERVVVVASAGDTSGYLDGLEIHTDDGPLG